MTARRLARLAALGPFLLLAFLLLALLPIPAPRAHAQAPPPVAQAAAPFDPVATLQRFFDAMNAGDAATALSLVTDRIALEGVACSIGIDDCVGLDAVAPIIAAAAEAAAEGVTFTNQIVSAQVSGNHVTGIVHERAPNGFVAVDRIILFLDADFVGTRIERLRLTPDLSDPQTAAADHVARNFTSTLAFFNVSVGVFSRFLQALNAGDLAAAAAELGPDVRLQGALCAGASCVGRGVARLTLLDWRNRDLNIPGNLRLLVNDRAGVGVTGVLVDDAGLRFDFQAEVVGRHIRRLRFQALPPELPPLLPAVLPATGSGGLADSGRRSLAPAFAAALAAATLAAIIAAIATRFRRHSPTRR